MSDSQTIQLRPDLRHFEAQPVLDGVQFVLQFDWNARAAAWFMNVLDADRTQLYMGVKIVVDHPLAKRLRNSLLPAGLLTAHDTSRQRVDPGIDDLGDRVILLYFEAANLPIVPI